MTEATKVPETFEEAKSALLKGNVPAWNAWREANPEARVILSQANLAGLKLAGAKLAGAYLTGASLLGTNLTEADLTEADLTYADFTGAELMGANLTGAFLAGANLQTALGAPVASDKVLAYIEAQRTTYLNFVS